MLGLLVDIDLARDDIGGCGGRVYGAGAVVRARGPRGVRVVDIRRLAGSSLRARTPTPVRILQSAVERFTVLELPLEAARARLSLARAMASDTPAAAAYEAGLAFDEFDAAGGTARC